METFQILYFRESVLEDTETIEALDLLEAIERASGRPPDLRAEIWSEKGKVGIVGPSMDSAVRGRGLHSPT